ncbi:MAG: 50S ribosomal protein L4 [Rickettsiales bacterium]|nr:50S ribosomal protein L4 [Rickettsiales bacterium]
MKLKVLNLNNLQESFENIDGIELDVIEGEKCVPYVVKWQLAKDRLGTARTKLLSEISGSTKKIVRQKGTGGARHGGKRAVQFVGGVTCFGPKQRDYSFSIPKKIVKKALSYVLRSKAKEGKLLLIEGMEDLELGTNKLNKKLQEKDINRALVSYDAEDYKNFSLSLRNLFNYKSLVTEALNVYDILNFDYLLVDKKNLNKLKEVL